MIQKAKDVLLKNWKKEGYTTPSPELYPYQWNWDSGFMALGYMYFDIEKAKTEMKTLFDAQWSNGFLPHIIFHNFTTSKKYFPGADFYNSSVNKHSFGKTPSSGLTQPPVHGFVLERMLQIADGSGEIKEFIKKLFAKVVHYHRYLYENRDIYNEGLVSIFHNWESGTDNSVVWDTIWQRIETTVPEYQIKRQDTEHVENSQRPKQREYHYYLYLIDLAKNSGYDEKKMAQNSPFIIQDPLFNTCLQKSNESLLNLASILKIHDFDKELNRWIFLTKKGMNEKLYDEGEHVYKYYDLVSGEKLNAITSSGLVPLFAGIPSEENAKEMMNVLNGKKFRGEDNEYYLCPSCDTTDERFESQRYWRGPVWINLNWMLYLGLKRYHNNELAEIIKKDTISIIKEQGFYEYFEPQKEKSKKMKAGYGGADFGWTAALYLDLMLNDETNSFQNLNSK